MIPLFVECTGKQVVIFGGGEVAARKAGYFAKEAEVLMVSRTFAPAAKALPVQIQTLDTRTATDADLDLIIAPAFLVIGALSDKAENDRIGRSAGSTACFSTARTASPATLSSRR